jgi:carboxyl-terminal processing protease
MLSHHLPAQHFDHKSMDDALSETAFALYLEQLDPRKRFLLKTDVDQLQSFALLIDDAIRKGQIVLPDVVAEMLRERTAQVSTMVDELFAQGFDAHRKDFLEVDPDKFDYAADLDELKERWRRSLKIQVIDTYLDNVEAKKQESKNAEQTAKDAGGLEGPLDSEQWEKALESVKERTHQVIHRLEQENRQDYFDRFFNAVSRAFDPHTNYMAPTSKEDFDIHMSGSLEGIGALLREDDGFIKVVRIIPGSAAERQGELQAEDVIMAVAEEDEKPVEITGMRIRDAVTYIRGPKGTEVRLTVRQADGTKKVIPIVRDVVQIEETYVKSTMLKGPGGEKVGYIDIPSFYRDFEKSRNSDSARNVTTDTRKALVKLSKEGMESLILDLRNNGGGSLGDAVDVSGLFLKGGPVVQVKNSQGVTRVLEDDDPSLVYEGPMIVLVNKFSASASEILAAALQDYGRALIVGGSHTHGKGTVQALLDMNRNLPLLHLKKYEDLGALKVTIQKFYRVDGRSTQFKGVEPDVVIPSTLEYLESGEKYLDHALPWDQVEDVYFVQWQGDHIDVSSARERGKAWLEESEDFKKIKKSSELVRKRQEETQVPAYLEGIILERQQNKEAQGNQSAPEFGHADQDREPQQKEEKELDEQLAEDPWVDFSLFLLQNADPKEKTALRVQ